MRSIQVRQCPPVAESEANIGTSTSSEGGESQAHTGAPIKMRGKEAAVRAAVRRRVPASGAGRVALDAGVT